MAKRKSDAIDLTEDAEVPKGDPAAEVTAAVSKPKKKKARVSKDASDDEGAKGDKEGSSSKSKAASKPKHWTDIKLEGEEVRTRFTPSVEKVC